MTQPPAVPAGPPPARVPLRGFAGVSCCAGPRRRARGRLVLRGAAAAARVHQQAGRAGAAGGRGGDAADRRPGSARATSASRAGGPWWRNGSWSVRSRADGQPMGEEMRGSAVLRGPSGPWRRGREPHRGRRLLRAARHQRRHADAPRHGERGTAGSDRLRVRRAARRRAACSSGTTALYQNSTVRARATAAAATATFRDLGAAGDAPRRHGGPAVRGQGPASRRTPSAVRPRAAPRAPAPPRSRARCPASPRRTRTSPAP